MSALTTTTAVAGMLPICSQSGKKKIQPFEGISIEIIILDIKNLIAFSKTLDQILVEQIYTIKIN